MVPSSHCQPPLPLPLLDPGHLCLGYLNQDFRTSTPHLATSFPEKKRTSICISPHRSYLSTSKKKVPAQKRMWCFYLCHQFWSTKDKGVQPSLGIQNISFSFVLPKIDIKHKNVVRGPVSYLDSILKV